MKKISELGYLGVGAGDFAAWERVATTVFGMQVVPGDTAGTSYLRIDDAAQRRAVDLVKSVHRALHSSTAGARG